MSFFNRRGLRIAAMLKIWLNPVGRPGFSCFLCLISLLLFTWPLLAEGFSWSSLSLYCYYFLVWTGLIAFILIIGLRLPPSRGGRGADEN